MRISPTLQDRIDRLASCDGHWLLIRDGVPETDCSHQWHQSPGDHLETCLRGLWRGLSLGFVPGYCGYSDYSNTGLVGLSNFMVLQDPQSTPDPCGGILEIGYGWNGRGTVLDVRYVPDDVIETIEGLEAYPLISDDEHSLLEAEGIVKLWEEESIADRVRTLQEMKLCIFSARNDSLPWEQDSLRDSILSQLNEYPTILA